MTASKRHKRHKRHLGNHKGRGMPFYGKDHSPRKPKVGRAAGKACKANGNWTPRDCAPKKGSRKGKPTTKQYTDAMIADALRRSYGLKSHAAALLGMDATYLGQRINKSPDLLKVLDEAKESLLDGAESGLRKGTDKGKGWAVMFALDRLGHKRGYLRPEIAHVPGGATWAGGIPTDLAEWPKADLDRLIAAIANRLEVKDEAEAFA